MPNKNISITAQNEVTYAAQQQNTTQKSITLFVYFATKFMNWKNYFIEL